MNTDTHTHRTPPPDAARHRRVVGALVLAVVLGLSFLGYLTPSMRIQWENFMSMCGF
ncbi:MAG: hypothetical protein OZ927_01430 [Alcaligenaceae bacterium]|nr:hypothetical protein [Alcaligenaceae bacterium]